MILKMYMERIADQTDHFPDAFVRKIVAYSCEVVTTLENLQQTPFCLDKIQSKKMDISMF